jgi:hypothetical protein
MKLKYSFFFNVFCIILILTTINAFSQAPSVIFQKAIGGSINEEAYSVIPTDDGGYMLGGWTNSDDGFVSRTLLSQGTPQDTYFIKLNSLLQKQWNYSPTTPSVSYGSDFGFSFIKTTDGGFISSGNSANEEIVIVKINSNGGLVWEKSYLSSIYGSFKSQIIQTLDGGYLVVAESYILVGYNKKPNILLLKISSNGTTEWTKTYGGSDSDFVAGLTQTNDGNFVIASYSYSSDGDVGSNNGGSDAWILKVDSFGNIIWKKKYGTHNNEVINGICSTNDGGIAVCGKVFSNTASLPYSDFLVYKLNTNADLEWSSVFGSAFSDLAESITESNSRGFLVSGSVGSGNYEETASSGSATNLNGKEDLWIVKLGITGNLLWEKTLGGNDNDVGYFVKELLNSDILVAGRTQSADEDVSDYNGGGGPLRGGDMWLIKLGFNVKSINAQAFYAPNSNVKINSICPGGNLDLKVKLEGYSNQSNVFKIQMSDSNGSFTTPIILSIINSSSNFTQNITIPANTSYGNKYKIRVIDELNNIISYNSRTLIINSNLPTGEIYEGSASVAKGSTVTIKARFTGIAPWSFTISEGGVSTIISDNSNNPYIFNRVVNNSQSFTLSSVSNQCGVGTTSGRADIRMTYGGLKVADINHYISNVKLCDFKGNQVDNTSTNQLGDYSNLQPLNLQKGVEYALKSSVYNSYYYSGTITSFKIYIDINKDTSFTANELIYSTSQNTISSGNFFIGSVIIPETAINGLTRLRIVTQSSQHITLNDVEDYAINIFSSFLPTITLGEIANTSTNILCAGNSFNVDFKKYNIQLNDYRYQVHLSDKNGLFTNSILIGSGQNSPIAITIPSNTEVGTNFKLKLSVFENSLINSIKCGNFSVNKPPTATISLSSDTILLNGNLQLSAILTGGEPYSFNVSGGVTTVPSTNGGAFDLNYNNTVTKPTNYQITTLSNTCGIGPNSNIASLRKVIKYCMPKFDFRLIRKFSMSQGNLDLVSYADIGGFYPDPLFNKNNVIVVKKGQQYDIKFSDSVYGNENVGIWLDSNQDSLFSSSEKIYQSAVNNVLNRIGTITIPTTAITGLTRMRVRVSKYASDIIQEACSLPANLFFTSELYGTRDFGLLILENNTTAISLRENTTLRGCYNSIIPMNINVNGAIANSINYRLELSDINGLWQNPLIVGTSATSPINITIPNNLSTTGNYQLRLLSDAPNAYYFQNTRNFKYYDKMESINSGLWNTQSIWSCGRFPQLTDDVYINSGHSIKLENYNGNARYIFLNGTLQYINGSVRLSN